ncbi:hypothetical protein BJY04DRAFT_221209 [Aspergillus karnatakaensis]|uniref:uncharacterized protein n=1 Tax=Aspergillus karnatakaensis TaxID=1810916 RepID=UPI003CCD93B6
MRLHLTIQRHGLPVTRILWTTSPPSLYGHNQPSPSALLPATASAVTSSRVPNALYASGGYTVAQLLEDVNEVIPLETEPRLFEDQSSGQWGLEDYVVEVGGSECLHFMELEGLLRDGDDVLIRALQIADLRARRLSGRHQISNDGKHLIDGVPFGKPFLKRPTSSRPAIMIPPRKKRRTALAIWSSASTYEEEDTEWAPSQHISTGKELSLLNPASELEKDDEDEDEYEDAYRDDYEDFHEPNEDGDGTVIRHDIDKTNEPSDSDDETPESEPEDLTQELQELQKDMLPSSLPEMERPDTGVPLDSRSLRSRPSFVKDVPRKSSLSRRSTRRPSDGDSKSVTFQKLKQEVPAPKPVTSAPRAGSTSEEPEDSVSSDSSSSDSDSSDSMSSDEDSSLDESASEVEEAPSSSESDSDSSSDSSSSDSESESEPEELSVAKNALKPSHEVGPPGRGSDRTKKSNQRNKMRRRLTKLKELGFLGDNADFAALREWDSKNGDSYYTPETVTDQKKSEQEEFEARRRQLLRDLESGGVDISEHLPEKENVSPKLSGPDTSQLTNDEHYETANDTNEASPEVSRRRTLDVASTRRLLFGSLGVRTPRSKEEEEATRTKLAGKERKTIPRESVQSTTANVESESEVDWREKLVLRATECVHDDIELSTPPFPFEQHWDADAGFLMQQRKKGGKKRKRKQRLQVYDEETVGDEGDYYVTDEMQLNYDDVEKPEAEHNGEREQTAAEMVEGADDLPELPSDTAGLPNLDADGLKPGLVFAFKQLDVSKATNWQPQESDYRVAVLNEVFNNNIVSILLAKPYRKQPRDIDNEDPFQYSGFEMPDMDDDEEDDGIREVPFDELRSPKLLRAAPAADAEDKDTASIIPADEEQAAQKPSQLAIDDSGISLLEEKSIQTPTSPNDNPPPISSPLLRNDSPILSPRFEGFELSQPSSNPHPDPPSSPAHSIASSSEHRDEQQARESPKVKDDVQSPVPSSCPLNVDDHDHQEIGLTEQLQAIRSPSVIDLTCYDEFVSFLESQPSPVKSEKNDGPDLPIPEPDPPTVETSSPSTVPNPFYFIDKAHAERRQLSQANHERDRSFDSVSNRKRSPETAPPSHSKPPREPKPPSPEQEAEQETSQVSMIPDSFLPEKEPSPPASQMPEFIVDLTQSSPPVSPGGSDEDFARTHRLPRGSGWVQKNVPSTRRQTRQSSSSSRAIRTLEDMSISPPQRRRGRKT